MQKFLCGLNEALKGSRPLLLRAILLYGAGLRLIECCRLRIKGIDFSRNELVVRSGKGNKDRYTMLPSAVRPSLMQHLRDVKLDTKTILRMGWAEFPCPLVSIENIPTPAKSGMAVGVPRNQLLYGSCDRRKAQAPFTRVGFATSFQRSASQSWCFQTRWVPYPAPFICYPFTRKSL
jgi:integrase